MTKASVGDRIKELRLEKGISQSFLAKKLGTSKTTISNYETNYSVPSKSNLKKLSEFFEANVDYILGESDFKDRFLLFKPAGKVPHYLDEDIDAMIQASTNRIAGIDDIPSFGQEKLSDSLSVTMPDDSMIGTGIFPNSRVYILRDNKVPTGKAGAVVYQNKVYVRRLLFHDDHVTLVPDSTNSDYMPIQAKKSEVIVLGRVVKTLNDVN